MSEFIVPLPALRKEKSTVDGVETYLHPEMFTEIQIAFNINQTDGIVTAAAIGKLLRSIGHECGPRELYEMMSEVDAERSGALDFLQFIRMMENLVGQWNIQERLAESFRIFDSNDNGTVVSAEMQNVMTTLTNKMTAEEAEEFVSCMQSEAPGPLAGLLDYVTFSQKCTEIMLAEAAKKKGKKGGKKGGKKKKK